MILRRLRVERIRKLNRPVEIDFTKRFVVVEGPNEVGKSTLFTALEYAFFRRSSGSGEDINRLMPWNAEVRPILELDFQYEGVEYRLQKSWEGKGSTLVSTIDAAGQATPYKSEGADDWLITIFAGEAGGPGSRAMGSKNLGLAHLLFAAQGHILIDGDGLNSNARGRLAELVGAVSLTSEESRMIGLAKGLFDEVWTPGGKTGRSKKKANAESAKFNAESLSIKEELATLKIQHQQFLETGEKYQSEQSMLEERRRQRDASNLHFEELLPRITEAAAARSQLESAERAAADKGRDLEALVTRLAKIADFDVRRTGLVDGVELRRRELDVVATKLAECDLAEEATAKLWSDSNALDQPLEEAQTEHNRVQRFRTDQIEHKQLGDVLVDIERYDAEIAKLAMPSGDVPTTDELRELREQLDRRTEVQAALRNAETVVTIRALGPTVIEHDGSNIDLATGANTELNGMVVRFSIPGVAEIQARGPASDRSTYLSEQNVIDEALHRFEKRFGTLDYSELVRARAALDGKMADLGRLRTLREERLGSHDVSELRVAVAELAKRLGSAPRDLDLATLANKVQVLTEARASRMNSAKKAFDLARVQTSIARSEKETAERAEAKAKSALQELDIQLTNQLGGSTRESLREERIKLDISFSLAARRVEDATLAYAPYRDIEEPGETLQSLHREKNTLQEMVEAQEKIVAGLQQRFEDLQNKGLFAEIGRLEERLEELARAESNAKLNEDAIFMLHETLSLAQTARSEGISQSIERDLAPWYERVTGTAFTQLQLGEKQDVETLDVMGVGRPVRIDELSSGARDQFGTLVRLAFAKMIAEKEPLPVLLDDPLVNADRSRRAAMLRIMREVSEKAQVIVFTCRVEDYLESGAEITGIKGVAV